MNCFSFSFFFSLKKNSSFLFSCISFKYVLLVASVSEFICFLRSRCSMEMWCPDDTGQDSWDWVGPPAWGEGMIQLPRVEWKLLACYNGASPDCFNVVVVWDTIENVCMITPPHACTELPAHSTRANLETWGCTKPR